MSNKLFDAMESVAYTENGALTYSTSLNHNLDFLHSLVLNVMTWMML